MYRRDAEAATQRSKPQPMNTRRSHGKRAIVLALIFEPVHAGRSEAASGGARDDAAPGRLVEHTLAILWSVRLMVRRELDLTTSSDLMDEDGVGVAAPLAH